MRFKFKAVKPTGEHFEGVKDNSDKLSLYKEIEKEGNTVISVTEMGKKHGKFSFLRVSLGFLNKVSTKNKIMFAGSLGSMLEAGLPMTRALSVIERQTRDKKLKSVFSELQDSVSQGKTLNEALSQFPDIFSDLFISMVKAGEESGSVSEALKSVSNQMNRTYLLVKKLRGAMIYPAVVVAVMITITILLLVYLVPVLSETFTELNLELPLSTKIVITLSEFLQNNAVLSIVVSVALILGFFIFIKTSAGKKSLDLLLLHIPIVKTLVKESNSARTSRTLSSLLTAGVDFLVAIRITRDVVQNSFYKKVLESAEETVKKGGAISSTFLEAEHLYPPFVGEMTSIGEETGKLSEMLSNTASFYEEAIDDKTKNLSSIIEPILVVIIGLFVAVFAIAMLGPIYSLVGSVDL